MPHTPPPLPPAQNDKSDPAGLPSTPSQHPGTQLPGKAIQPANVHTGHTEEIDYEVVSPKKANPWLWAIPVAIIVLLIGGGIYAYFYMQHKHEKEQAELREEQEAEEEARLEREKAIADSIAYNDSLRLNFTSPDLAMFNLKGHVKSVMTKRDNYDGGQSIMLMLFNDKNISFDYDGNCTSLASELGSATTPSISRSGDYITDIDFNYSYDSEDDYSFTWSGNRITNAKNIFNNGSYSDSYTAYDGNDPASISQTYTWTSDYDSYSSNKHTITFTITYSDRDEYGNWTKAQVSGSGTETRKWSEEERHEYWNGYYWDYSTTNVPKTETENVNFSYTITRYIDYHEYVPVKY